MMTFMPSLSFPQDIFNTCSVLTGRIQELSLGNTSAANVLLTLVLLRVLYIVIHRLFLSSLSKLPGPRFTALSGLWLMYHEFSRSRRQWVHDLHLRYGPVVRIAPNEVSFANRDAVKEIYTSGGSGYDKTSLYDLFSNFETQNMFSTQDRSTHSEFKKCIADRYTKGFIMQPAITSNVEENAELVVMKCTETTNAPVDIYIPLHCYALDCISHHLFHPFGTRSLTGQPADMKIVEELTFYDSLKSYYFRYHFPRLASLNLPLWKGRHRRQEGHTSSYVLTTTTRTDPESHTLLYKLQHLKEERSQLLIASECMDHLVAGIDTTSDALCFLLHHLSLPDSFAIQERLHRELEASPGAPIDNLPYLDAVVKEGLRLFTPIPMSLPRKVPSGGRTIGGFFVPEATIVSCQAYSLHRIHGDIFQEPESFVPERWLSRDGELERNQLFFVFSQGGRGCIGKHLALLEIKTLLRAIYCEHRTHIAPEMNAFMDFDDQIISTRPKNQKCLLIFQKV